MTLALLILWGAALVLWAICRTVWARGYNRRLKDEAEYWTRHEFDHLPPTDLAMKFLQSRRPSEPEWSKEDILKVYKGVMKYDDDEKEKRQ